MADAFELEEILKRFRSHAQPTLQAKQAETDNNEVHSIYSIYYSIFIIKSY